MASDIGRRIAEMDEEQANPMVSHYDDRTDRCAIFATNCLGCNCAEGYFHAKDCPWREEPVPPKMLVIDIKKLIEQYGLRPRWASLDREGRLTIAGHSKEGR